MKVTSRADYALSCILIIAARYSKSEPVTVKYVAQKEKLDPDYVEQLFVAMKKAGILKSIRGKNGGYILAAPPDKITAKDVVEAIDEAVLKLVCDRKKGRRSKCVHLGDCEIRNFWNGLKGNMESFLRKNTLEKLVELRKKEKNWRFEEVKK